MKEGRGKCRLTSSNETQIFPPSTSLSRNVFRAFSTSRSALAIHRRASLEASGSSLKEVDRERRTERLGGEAINSEPDGFLPRVLSASRACAASGRR
jgi:hypothetical protein